MEKIDKIDALAACVKAMRSEDVDEAEQAMLDKLTNVLTHYTALRALGDCTKSLPVHHDDGRRAAGGVYSNSKHAVSCPNVMRQPSLAFNTVDELASCAARRGRGAREVRSEDVDEVEPTQENERGDEVEKAMLDQLTHVLRKYKARRALGDSRKTIPVHPSATGSVRRQPTGPSPLHHRAANHRRFSDFSTKPPADLQQARRVSEPALAFKVHTLPAYAWLTDGGARPFHQKSGKGPTWDEHVAQTSRSLQASHRTETCVWRRGDDVQ